MSYREKIFEGKSPLGIHNENTSAPPAMGGDTPPFLEQKTPDFEMTEVQLCAGFDAVEKELRKDLGDLHNRIERIKSNGVLRSIEEGEYFTPEHWEMAAILEFYDQKTFDHSLRVLQFIYEIVMADGETANYLKNKMRFENPSDTQATLDDLFVAALFHDIGKTAIPQAVLHDHKTRREWAKQANLWAKKQREDTYFDESLLQDPEDGGLDEAKLDGYFMKRKHEAGFDPLDIVPLNEVFDEPTLVELEAHGFHRTGTFRRILERHEIGTRAILWKKKMYVASDIASHHHDYEKKPIRSEHYPTETSALRIAFELSILRSMDVYDALTSYDRSYKKPYHPLLAMQIITHEARAEFIDFELTQKIITDLYVQFTQTDIYRTYQDQQRTPPMQALVTAEQEILLFIQEQSDLQE